MRTGKEIMNAAFNEALDIVKNRNVTDLPSQDAQFIAASNIAMAIFSYEAEMEAIREANLNDDDDSPFFGEDVNG